MPKETIATNRPRSSDEPQDVWRLTLGWGRESGHVQLGASVDDNFDSGQYFTLDRWQINNLIRNLRKARDAAYGSDA